MPAYKFIINAYDGDKLLIEGFKTKVHRFPNATVAMQAVLDATGCTRRNGPSVSFHLDDDHRISLPHLKQGLGPDTEFDIVEIIEVEEPAMV